MPTITLPNQDQLIETCKNDGEFMLGCRHFTGSITLNIGEQPVSLTFKNGVPVNEPAPAENKIVVSAPMEVWGPMLMQKPMRMFLDINLLIAGGYAQLDGDLILFSQYYSAVCRMIELLREPGLEELPMRDESGAPNRHDTPVGRYIHIDIQGQDYRIYYEEAGVGGIPLVLQHTAGAHGSQWRHLFEMPEITKHFHLIAYDLPYHGKSIPPVGKDWWKSEYKLKGDFLRRIPVGMAKALKLDRPIFMGCSVGGMLALDLAYHHPDVFSHVISLEGALKVQDVPDELLSPLWHPQVSNEFKSRFMNGIMSPTSPEAYRKETTQVYSAGWPNAFLGDVYYYMRDYDLSEKAKEIDTSKCGVTIMSGEYDASSTWEMSEEAHQAISGSNLIKMNNIGHFAMSENPVLFAEYLMPVLEEIKANS